MPDRQLTLEHFLASESNLRAFETELILLRELIRSNPNYTGDWLEHPQWKRARRFWRATVAVTDPILKKRQARRGVTDGN